MNDKKHVCRKYALELNSTLSGFISRIGVFYTCKEAEAFFANSYIGKLDDDKYVNVVFLEYDEYHNLINVGVLYKLSSGGNVMPNTKTYHKLVRDYIPDIILSKGYSCEIESLCRDDYILALDTKLMEEFGEFLEHRDVEELADMLEVLFAMAKTHGYSWLDVVSANQEKREKRGGFDKCVFLKTVTEE